MAAGGALPAVSPREERRPAIPHRRPDRRAALKGDPPDPVVPDVEEVPPVPVRAVPEPPCAPGRVQGQEAGGKVPAGSGGARPEPSL